MHIFAERIQYRVGHGGFHSTIITAPKPESEQGPLVYVYDIGALPSKALARDAIDRFVRRLIKVKADRVAYIILSHIDEDHVNCLTDLLNRLNVEKISVGTVLLPWLNTAEKLLAKSHANHRTSSTVVMNLAGADEDILQYLAELGVDSVAFLRSQDATEPPLDIPPAFGPTGTAVRARSLKSGIDLTLSQTIPWKLIAMRIAPPRGTTSRFVRHLRKSTGLDPNDSANHPTLLTTHRSKIRAAMRASAVTMTGYGHSLTNWSCISIFGAARTPVSEHTIPAAGTHSFQMNCDHGWLHTGDLPLHIPAVWQAFELAWDAFFTGTKLCAVTAPHHGSPNGHNAALYAKFTPGAAVFTTGLSSRSTPGNPIYSKRNSPQRAMRDAASTATVRELNKR